MGKKRDRSVAVETQLKDDAVASDLAPPPPAKKVKSGMVVASSAKKVKKSKLVVASPAKKVKKSELVVDNKHKIYVNRLNRVTCVATLKAAFRDYGKVSDVHLPLKPDKSNLNRGFAFVTFIDESSAEDALRQRVLVVRVGVLVWWELRFLVVRVGGS